VLDMFQTVCFIIRALLGFCWIIVRDVRISSIKQRKSLVIIHIVGNMFRLM